MNALPKILVIGAGGLGAQVVWILARESISVLVMDDDVVSLDNLHRQIAFDRSDVGSFKVDCLAKRFAPHVHPVRSRLLPEGAREQFRSVEIVVEGSDNFATKYMSADAAFLEGKAIVQGSAIREIGTVVTSVPGGGCYRCLFEELPTGAQASCDLAGVLGPVCGLVAARMAEEAMRLLRSPGSVESQVVSVNARREPFERIRPFAKRGECPLCGSASIRDVERERYLG